MKIVDLLSKRDKSFIEPVFQSGKSTLMFSGFVFLALVLWTFQILGLELFDFVRGFSNTGGFLSKMYPPEFGSLQVTMALAAETLVMSVFATVLGMLLGVTLAYVAAGNSGFGLALRSTSRFLIVFFRSIPDLVFAILLVALFGIGPAAGAIALGLGSIGMIGRLTSQAIEDASANPKVALISNGASRSQVFFGSTLRQVAASLVGLFLYRLDINFRSATLMGLVGAGGIGLLLKMTLGVLDYQGAMGVVAVIFAMIFSIEGVSIKIRASLIHSGTRRQRPWLNSVRIFSIATLLSFVLGLITYADQLWGALARLDYFGEILMALLMPDFVSNSALLFGGAFESIAIAIQGTFWGLFIGLPVGFLAARKQGFGKLSYWLARSFLVVKRGFPTLVIALIFVSAIGLGPLAGILAMAIGTGGALAKFVADSLEEGKLGPVVALSSNGASKWQQFVAGTLPQLSPTLLGHVLYSLDMNVRYATVLGIVGGGGIGVVILTSVRVLDFGTTSAALILILGTLLVLERISSLLRRKLR